MLTAPLLLLPSNLVMRKKYELTKSNKNKLLHKKLFLLHRGRSEAGGPSRPGRPQSRVQDAEEKFLKIAFSSMTPPSACCFMRKNSRSIRAPHDISQNVLSVKT